MTKYSPKRFPEAIEDQSSGSRTMTSCQSCATQCPSSVHVCNLYDDLSCLKLCRRARRIRISKTSRGKESLHQENGCLNVGTLNYGTRGPNEAMVLVMSRDPAAGIVVI